MRGKALRAVLFYWAPGVLSNAMRIPESFFVFINVVVRLLLKSPFHSLMSGNVLLINYTGRTSGKNYSTPVRYFKDGRIIRCFTSEHVEWWRNVSANPHVTLLVGGVSKQYQARVLERDPEVIRRRLVEFLAIYPQDAVYQEIRLNPDGSLNTDDLSAASHKAIVVEFEEL